MCLPSKLRFAVPSAVALWAQPSSDPALPPARHADPLAWHASASWAPPAAESAQCVPSSLGGPFIWREMEGLPWDSQEKEKKSFHRKGFQTDERELLKKGMQK